MNEWTLHTVQPYSLCWRNQRKNRRHWLFSSLYPPAIESWANGREFYLRAWSTFSDMSRDTSVLCMCVCARACAHAELGQGPGFWTSLLRLKLQEHDRKLWMPLLQRNLKCGAPTSVTAHSSSETWATSTLGFKWSEDEGTSKIIWNVYTAVVQLLSHVQLFVTPWTAAYQASLSFTVSWSLLKFTSIESVMLSNHLCSLLFLP